MSPIVHAEWQSRGYRIHASVHEPSQSQGIWVIFSHGFTSHRLGPQYLHVGMARTLARRGVGSVRFDFAGAGESEGPFHQLTVSTMVADLRTACLWVRDRYAPGKLIVLGHSLGGCVAAMAVDQIEIDGCILLAAVARPMIMAQAYRKTVSAQANADGYYEVGAHEMSLDFLEDLEKTDPVAAVSRGACSRFLVLHGDDDQTVPLEESHVFVDALRRTNHGVQFEIIPDANHRILSVEGRKRLYHIITRWLEEHFS
ncbi:MAG: alpha/beta fold hydrolase [Chitinivibrionales bacterium]|nr:alpha/beta fold hydrolase [Chitinivibrionales bacterium]MBD3355530.1 alpha/beta fold hydrolase [Chitinivibrionales bacterium]